MPNHPRQRRSEPVAPEDAGPVRMIVGLGNPGKKYDGTRHNVGFDLVDRLASEHGFGWRPEKKWKAEVARGTDSQLILAKPQTFMNLSGESVIKLGSFFKIPPAEILVVYDDADLPLGRLRIRLSGTAGGHNGVKSLIQHFGTDKFPRLKFGIGRDPAEKSDPRRDMVGHVLGRFSKEESDALEKSLARAAEAVNYALSSGLAAAMNRYNQNPDAPAKKPKQQSRKSPSESSPGSEHEPKKPSVPSRGADQEDSAASTGEPPQKES